VDVQWIVGTIVGVHEPPVAAPLALLEPGSYVWLQKMTLISYSVCQIGPAVSCWLQCC
jgi:hypothetical protein